MICGSDGWKLISPLVELIENSKNVKNVNIFIHEEEPNKRIMISDINESLYMDTRKKCTSNEKCSRQMNLIECDLIYSDYRYWRFGDAKMPPQYGYRCVDHTSSNLRKSMAAGEFQSGLQIYAK